MWSLLGYWLKPILLKKLTSNIEINASGILKLKLFIYEQHYLNGWVTETENVHKEWNAVNKYAELNRQLLIINGQLIEHETLYHCFANGPKLIKKKLDVSIIQ